MPDIWMNVDAALAEVPVNLFPLLDDTDFKSRETGIVYNQAGMDLVWNFVTTGGAFTQTAVTPTTGGDYDWAEQGDGMYTIEIPASGGGSINNDTEGFGWFTGYCTGVLPWRGPVIGFRSSALNDSLVNGTDYQQVDAVQVEGSDATNQIRDSVVDDATLIDASALNTLSGHDPGSALASGTALQTVDDNVDAILLDTGTDGVVLADNSITAAKVATGAIAADEIASTAANKIADHVIRRTFQNACDSSDGDTKTFRSLLGAIAKQVNKVAPSGSNLQIFEDDDITVLGTQAVTTDSGADPITALDTT